MTQQNNYWRKETMPFKAKCTWVIQQIRPGTAVIFSAQHLCTTKFPEQSDRGVEQIYQLYFMLISSDLIGQLAGRQF